MEGVRDRRVGWDGWGHLGMEGTNLILLEALSLSQVFTIFHGAIALSQMG